MNCSPFMTIFFVCRSTFHIVPYGVVITYYATNSFAPTDVTATYFSEILTLTHATLGSFQ